MKLKTRDVQTFQQQGYLEIPHRVIEEDHLQQLRKSYDQVFSERHGTSGQGLRNLSVTESMTDATEDEHESEMLQVMEMWQKSKDFQDLLYYDPLLDIAGSLIGENIQLFHDQALYKPAKIGGAVPWHQDNGYWRCQPADLVSIWIALDDADQENGCMIVIPASHVDGQVSHSRAKTGDRELPALLFTDANESKAVSVPLKAGHAMVHHCLTVHQTQPNWSDRDRRAIVIHYMPVGTENSEGMLLKDNLLLRGHDPHSSGADSM
ncbi:MAG: phytanoyl-CoA dioxygenase family protein [Candidatus Poribacteria bacterium]|nr:phytanoyl-CoA dioxygenase family protein [Candidatus Poribacteria bacterium]MDP6748492.1 phytanoyl-CoA dioxygenase family protein [Candidatus Poribacteria bacterium]MDP6997380.1 phytanoyl-CoA dioxygenase family protein [Candidatus Poribacteria bacterium]